MDSMSYILFICVAAPVLLMLVPIDSKSRKVILFLLTGMFCCLLVSEINGLLLRVSDLGHFYFTTNVTPITEEIIKVLPVLYFALVFSKDRKELVTAAFSVGVGFAILENLIILTQNYESVNIMFAVARGFSSGLMHSICTMFVAFFISFAKKNKKIFIIGTVSSLNLSITYHSVFNLLVQSDYTAARVIGLLLPFICYALINAFSVIKEKQKSGTKKAE